MRVRTRRKSERRREGRQGSGEGKRQAGRQGSGADSEGWKQAVQRVKGRASGRQQTPCAGGPGTGGTAVPQCPTHEPSKLQTRQQPPTLRVFLMLLEIVSMSKGFREMRSTTCSRGEEVGRGGRGEDRVVGARQFVERRRQGRGAMSSAVAVAVAVAEAEAEAVAAAPAAAYCLLPAARQHHQHCPPSTAYPPTTHHPPLGCSPPSPAAPPPASPRSACGCSRRW